MTQPQVACDDILYAVWIFIRALGIRESVLGVFGIGLDSYKVNVIKKPAIELTSNYYHCEVKLNHGFIIE